MKGLVLAGGSGTRLRPITFSSAKQLVPVANRPILFHALDQLADAGVRQVGVVVGEHGDEVRTAVGDGEAFGLEVTFIRQPRPLGIAHALLTAEEFLDGDDVVLFLGDNLVEGGVTSLVHRFASERPTAQLLVKDVDDPSAFGVAVVRDGVVQRLVEKPAEPPSSSALVGVYLLSHDVLEAARRIAPSLRGELEITDALQRCIDDGGRVQATELSGWWLDTGKKDDVLDANRLLLAELTGRVDGAVDAASRLTGTVVVEPGARVRGSSLHGPVVIGAGTRVTDAVVGPDTSVGERCELVDCEVVDSVVMADSRIDGVGRIEHCLVGRRVTLAAGGGVAHRIVAGDDSFLELRGGS